MVHTKKGNYITRLTKKHASAILEAYHGVTLMQPHQQRVVNEKKELNEKLDSLIAFIETSPIFKNLPADERERLGRQFDVMTEYSNILSQRIAAFG